MLGIHVFKETTAKCFGGREFDEEKYCLTQHYFRMH